MQQEEKPLIAPPAQPPLVKSSSTLLLFASILVISGAGTLFFSETMLVSPFALPLLFLIAGTLFVLKSYRGHSFSQSIATSDLSSPPARELLNRSTPDSPAPTQFFSPGNETEPTRTVDSLTVRTSGSSSIVFNVRTTVEEAVFRFAHVAKEKGIELSCLFSSDSPVPFRGDPGELRLILLNLIDHALSSHSPSEIVVRGALVSQTATHATFRFSVSSIQKIPTASLLPTLTLPRSDNNTSSPATSHETAGLALSKQLVQNWGGQFGFEKDPNLGATVWFTMMLEQQASHERSVHAPCTNLSSARILVVSDAVSLSETDVHSWGATSHHFLSSSPVYSRLTTAAQEGQPYDILLLHCPSLDATMLDLAHRIRKTETLAMLRLVLLTNWGRKGEARKVHDAGFDAYITNPASSTLLFECFTTLLGQPPQTPTSRLPLVTRYTLAEARMRGRNHILVVESNLSEQKHTARLVEESGYRVVIVTTAREAIESCTLLPYTAVLLPAQMPGINGIIAAEQIRQVDRKEGRHTPLIGIVSRLNNNEREQCLVAGMDTVIDRPLRTASLLEALRYCKTSATKKKNPPAMSKEDKEAPQLNFHEVLARLESEKELFNEIAAQFVKEYPKVLMKMREAIARQDTHVLAYNANALKGTLENFAATRAIYTISQLEEMGRRGDFSLASPVLTDLEKQLIHLQAQLADFQTQATA